MIDSPLLSKLGGYLDGHWCDAKAGLTSAVINPATGETIASIPVMGQRETERAIEAADRALAVPASIEERREWLSQLADLVTEYRDELGRIITLEHGKPWSEARGEADYAASFFRYYAGSVDHLTPKKLDSRPRDHRWTVYYRPAGVAALITPWNFPLAMLAKKFSAALAADCACVIKPSSKTPLTVIALFSLLERLHLRPGKANLVLGPAAEISEVLCRHPAVRVISFTGSTSVGKTLAAATAPHLKRLSLELGGNAPFIVFEDADLDSAVQHLVANKFRGAGQTCVCANRVYVERRIADAFAAKLTERVNAMRIGNGLDDDVDIGPLIDQNAFEKVRRHVEDAIQRGARRVTKREFAAPSPAGSNVDQGNFFPPTVLCGVTAAMACVREETFGPLAPILEFDSEQEVVSAANETEYGLAAYVFTADDQRAARVLARLNFGHVGLNTGTGPTAEAPFGGMKQSGYGREGGLEGLHDFIETQTVPCP